MNSKSTWLWAAIAAALFAFIFFFERHTHQPESGPQKILSGLRFAELNTIAVRFGNQLEIRAVRTNHLWQLSQPVAYPAQNSSVENLLGALEKLTPATRITATELRKRSKVDEKFGFVTPQASLILYRNDEPVQILLGACTAPGDQIFLRIVGVEDIFVVDAGLLNLIPRTANDWRDRTFAGLSSLAFNHILAASGVKVCELQRDGTNQPWRIIRPMPARANNSKVEEALKKLPAVRVDQFVPEDGRADLESFGLQPPDFELDFGADTNSVLSLQFGKNPTNDATQIFARRDGRNTVVTVAKEPFDAWRSPFETFRDHHLFTITPAVTAIEVHGDDNFTLQHQTNNTWLVQPQNFLADSNVVAGFLASLGNLQVTQFVKDVVTVTDPELPRWGLVSPARQIIFKTRDGSTNVTTVQLDFGATNEDRIFVRRLDEDSVYAVPLADYQRLPSASWLVRDRHIWNFDVNDVASVTIHQLGRTRKMIRGGEYHWSLAPGSQGVIDDLAVEEITKQIGTLTAAVWTERGNQNRTRYGFTDNGQQLTFELKDGRKFTVEFGGEAPSQFPYAAVTLEGEVWIFEFPWDIYQNVLMRFTIPQTLP